MAGFVSPGANGILDNPCALDVALPSPPPPPCCPSYLNNAGDALDVVIVSNDSLVACSDFIVRFSSLIKTSTVKLMLLNDKNLTTPLEQALYLEGFDMVPNRNGACIFKQGMSTKPSSKALSLLKNSLVAGKNPAQYVHFDERGEVQGIIAVNIYSWSHQDRIVVMDIDGTITKSNVRGVLDTVVLERHVYAHEGVCKFLSDLISSKVVHGEIRILNLTSRPMSLAQSTRETLTILKQNGIQLPPGPLFCHSGHLGQVLFSELISRDTHQYKADTLFRQVVLPFAAVNFKKQNESVFIAGFGNSSADAMGYEMAGIARQDIYMLDKQSGISCFDKHVVIVKEEAKVIVTKTIPSNDKEGPEPQNNNNNNRNGVLQMKAVRNRRSYRRLIGTTFLGYQDPRLLSNLCTKLAR